MHNDYAKFMQDDYAKCMKHDYAKIMQDDYAKSNYSKSEKNEKLQGNGTSFFLGYTEGCCGAPFTVYTRGA
jgi:hypothetical protein